ncbi:MAG: DNA ligase [Rubrivivax sp.]|nr:DNA ligase [Rubrivivax sp.]
MPFTRRHFLRFVAAALPTAATSGGHAWPTSNSAPNVAAQLARTAAADIDPRGHLVSEKLDGVRALWDGQRLRFRSGLPVIAPQWFVSRLPAVPLDGELWMGRGTFDALSGAVRRAAAVDADWRAVRYEVFDLPGAPGPFLQRAKRVAEVVRAAGFPALAAVQQHELADREALQRLYAEVVRGGGEGLVLHRADAPWRVGRSDAVLKLKPVADAEAQVVAHVPGRGRHEGRLGALQVRTPEGVEFLLGTGLSDAERERPPAVGSWVTYAYRGVTAQGVPRFASYLRRRDPRT